MRLRQFLAAFRAALWHASDEAVVLAAVREMGELAYSVDVIRLLHSKGWRVTPPSYHRHASKLVDKGYLQQEDVATRPGRGGRPLRRHWVTPAGSEALGTDWE